MDNQLELYKSIFDDAVDAIFIGDEKGNFIIVNKSAENLTGYTKKELLKLNMSDLFSEQTLTSSPLKYSHLDSNQVITKKRELIKKDGSLIPVEMKSKKLANGIYQSFIRDITERKQKEREIKENKERYKILFELSPSGIILEDSQGTIIDANPVIHKTFGYKKNELIGKNIRELAYPESYGNIKDNIQKILNGSKLKHVVKSLKNDGTEIYNELYETKILLPNIGEGILSISNDITKQVIAEQKLKESENRFRNIIEHSSNMFYTHTADHKLTYVSPQVRYFLDCEPEEALIGWTDFITDNPINKLGLEKTQKAIETGVAQTPYELELITKKGRKLIVEVHESPVVKNGKTISIVGALIDITDKKRLELSYKELFEYAPITIAEEDVTELFDFYDELKQNGITDLRKYFDNHPEVLINCIKKIKPIRINNSGLKLYGFKNSEDYKKNFESVFTTKSLDAFKEQLIAFFNGSSTFSAETETIIPTGEIKNFLMKIQLKPQIESGKQIELFSLIDITTKKQAEVELKKSKEQLQFAIEGSGVGLWDWNITLGITKINSKWASILGYSINELLPLTDSKARELVHPLDFQKSKELIYQNLNGEIPSYANEFRMKHKSGNWKWILTRGKIVEWDDKNNPIRMVGTSLDITDRKLSEFLLKKYMHEIESLFHLSQEMIQNFDTEEIINSIPGHIVQALNNAEAASIWKYNESEDYFEIVSWFGFVEEEAKGLTLPKSNTLIGEIYTKKKGVICNNTVKDILFQDGKNNLPTKATLGTPLFEGEEVAYIIFADNFSSINVFSEEDLKILQSFANISSIAINNVKLYDKIKTSELKFRTIFDSVGESIFIHDAETGRIIDVNKNVLEMYDCTYKEALELKPNDSGSGIYPYTAEEAYKLIQKTEAEGPQLFEWHTKKKNGELFWTEVNLRKIQIGNKDRIVAVVRDITERKRNEQQIYYQANLLDSANDAIIASSDKIIGEHLNNKITFWNKGAEKLFGWKKEEVIGKNIRDLISLEIINNTFENLVQDLIEKGFWSGDTIQYDKKGNKKYIHLSVSAIKKNGKIIGSIGVNHDITDKIIAEQAIKENEAKINSIMRGAPVGIGFIRNRILEYVNNHLLKMLGYSRKEMIGKSSKMFYESLSEYDKIGGLYDKLKNKNVTFGEARIVKKSGEIIEVIITLSPLEKNDLSKGLVFIVLDITEKREAEIRRKELEVSYQDIFDNTSDAIYIQDSNGKFIDVNKGVVEMYGYPKETFIGNTPEFLSAEGKNNLEEISNYIKGAFNNKPAQFEFWGKKKDGTIFPKLVRIKKGSYLGKDVVIAFALDITDIKNAQEVIKKERDQVQKYLDIAGVMLGVLDRNGTITLMNKKGVEILEYSEKELIGKNWFDNCLPKEIIPEIKKFFNKTMKGDIENIRYYENPILTKHGKTKLIAFHNTVLINSNSEITGVLFSGEDITEKDLAKKKLEKSEFNLKEAQRIAKIGHWELDILNNILYWSDEVYRIFNLDRHNFEATYESFLSFIHPEDREYVNNRYNDSIKNHTPYSITHRIKLKNGNIKYIREIGKTFYNKNKAVRSIGTIQDITERVLAEQKLNSQLKRNQLILNTTNDGFILADDKGNIFDVNPAYCKLVGYTAEELKTMNIKYLEISIPKEQIDLRIKKMLKQGYDNFETQHITKYGKKIDLSISIAITKYENKPFVAAFVRDITLQKQSLENLKKSREEISELAQHLQDIREEERRSIAAEIHDDLGQSLTALKLDTTILLKLLSNSDKAITKKIESMKDLADQTIRTVQKISSELRPGILDDLGLAAAIEWETSKFQERTNIKCSLTLEPSDISLSENLNVTIFRLFQETCTNVARHAKATELDIIISKRKNKLIMKINDNGIGITASQINDNKSFGIIGMKERLKNLNGKINFIGQPNKGTTVQIEVPLKNKDQK